MDKKEFFVQSTKGGIFAFILSAIAVLLLALLAKLFTINGEILPTINQVLKGISVIAATGVSVRGDRRVPKALMLTVVFCVLNIILFVSLGGEFGWGQILLDLGIAFLLAILSGAFLSRKTV
jgi:hypothetical protein